MKKQPLRGQKGFALVVVIVIMLMVSFLAGQLTLNVRTELKIAHNGKQRASGRALAMAGINLGLFRIMDEPKVTFNEEIEDFYFGREYGAELESGRLAYVVNEESGKIEINYLNRPLLTLFFNYLGLDGDSQQIIIDSMSDWRDNDNFNRLHGAELDYYQGLTEPYIPRNGKFAAVSELLLVRGADELASRLSPGEVFTVYNRSPKINFNNLPPLLLDFLMEGDEERIALYWDLKELEGTLTAEHAKQVLGSERYDLCFRFLSYGQSGTRYYTIRSRGWPVVDGHNDSEQEPAMEIAVLVKVSGDKVWYLSWQEVWKS